MARAEPTVAEQFLWARDLSLGGLFLALGVVVPVIFHAVGGGHLGSEHQLRAFVGAILDGTPVPCSLEDGIHVTEMTAAVDRSLSTGETVRREDVAGA